ncbi:hypothetical protein DEJ44_10065 [Streptomyces venezuelae]|uniref:hypothetical protein n=1 Tax=Streptomyces venezuelae TaxID=54571 RepID=UPI001238EFE9|nr:hypothetical protein [Streptomyces venezuelae]QES05928.1 hypothetical protein DEJ44_10065 [Streptomyces venezuelae]
MNRRRNTVAALLALLALAGCGIQGTDVVEAGGAATVAVQPIPEDRIVLYFLGPDGRSMPVARRFADGGPVPSDAPESGATRLPYDGFGPDYEITPEGLRRAHSTTDKILAMLLAGPRADEAAAGITTGLPQAGGKGPIVEPDATAGATPRRLLRLRAPFPVMELTEGAARQLVCTTAYAEHPAGLVDVSVIGPDGTLPTARCDE